jgi:hypothetical protein
MQIFWRNGQPTTAKDNQLLDGDENALVHFWNRNRRGIRQSTSALDALSLEVKPALKTRWRLSPTRRFQPERENSFFIGFAEFCLGRMTLKMAMGSFTPSWVRTLARVVGADCRQCEKKWIHKITSLSRRHNPCIRNTASLEQEQYGTHQKNNFVRGGVEVC